MVALRSPEDPSLTLVYRVVGLPGEEIEIAERVVRIDGEPLLEPYAQFAGPAELSTVPEPYRRRLARFGPLRIPEGSVFVLGDNRDRSHDSRFLGPVPIENVYAKPLDVYWNSDPSGSRDYSRIGTRIQ